MNTAMNIGDVTLWPEDDFFIKNMTAEQHQLLKALNERLIDIEQKVVIEAYSKLPLFPSRVVDSNDWLDDYECECHFKFSIGKNDPDYSEDSDNFIVRMNEYMPKVTSRGRTACASGENWNEYENCKDHPMQGEFHCWLFRWLYAYSNIGWINILRITEVWIDLTFTHQHWEYALNLPGDNRGNNSQSN